MVISNRLTEAFRKEGGMSDVENDHNIKVGKEYMK